MISIYKYKTDNEVRAIVEPDQQSREERQLNGQHVVILSFSLPIYIDFKIGDYASIFGTQYKLNTLPVWTLVSDYEYGYTLLLEAPISDLGKAQFLGLDQHNELTEGKFSLKTNAEGFLRLIIQNILRLYPDAGWQIGSVIETEYIDLEFDSNNCLEVLARLATQFSTEYVAEGRKVSLYKKQIPSGLTFKYGKNEALAGISRQNQDNSNKVTRLYVYGGNKNIGSNYRDGAQRLRMPDSLYVEKDLNKSEVVEETIILEDIFPRRTGVISEVVSPFVFKDAGMDFNVNDVLLPGVEAILTFNTGLLAGYKFTISAYNNALKQFTINANTDEQTVEVPSVVLTPAVGDQYVLTELLMPIAYVNNAEAELKNKGLEKLDEINADKPVFTVVCNTLYFKRQNKTVTVGHTVTLDLEEVGLNRLIRIIAYTRNLREPALYSMTLSDTVKQSTIVKLINGL